MQIRVGFGYDVHQLAAGRRLVLGGVEITHEKGCVAHSDGDVLIHALCDALLGAANLRDIGYHFPDNSGEFKDISSLILLERTMKLVRNAGWEFSNADTTLVLEKPRIGRMVPEMARTMAVSMGTDASCISIKATTQEKMGFVGKEKGVIAYATVLITRNS
jgi:2-C-methyl-D-erythritol 2,4-cyclodiphosphate synthase